MEATEVELNSFFVKFRELWKGNHTAHLDLDACEGKLWVGIRLQLGGDVKMPVVQNRNNITARQRRRQSF